MESTWETRDLPVLEAAIRYLEDHGGSSKPQAFDLAPMCGLDGDEVGKAILALEGEYLDTWSSMGGLTHVGVERVYGNARRAVGQWPSGETMAERILAAMNEAADNTPDPETKSKMRQTAAFLGGAGKDLFINLLAAIVAKHTGLD